MARTAVYVSGASGNVGKHLVRALIGAGDLQLVGGWAIEDGWDLGEMVGLNPLGIKTSNDLNASLKQSAADVVIDFTSPAVVMDNLRIYAEHGLDAVVGTTGFTEEWLSQARKWAKDKHLHWALIANFCMSMNLALDFMKSVRAYYPNVTIIEKHYAQKADAPSGTSMWLAKALATGGSSGILSKEVLPGVLGGEVQDVKIHSVRLPTPAAHGVHEIIMAKQDEVLTISVTDYSSAIYVDPVFLAVRKLKMLPAGTVITSLGDFPGGLKE